MDPAAAEQIEQLLSYAGETVRGLYDTTAADPDFVLTGVMWARDSLTEAAALLVEHGAHPLPDED